MNVIHIFLINTSYFVWVYANIFDSEKAVDKNGARATSDHVEGTRITWREHYAVGRLLIPPILLSIFLMTVQKWKSAGNIFMY